MEFKKIQLTGFKSFVEKTIFLIEDGLTGIVGPNGCGKSNIVESLRWCMGESSAKSMRGSGMEDVIFSGTSNMPSKNIAEVSITLSNSEKSGPIQFRELDIINVKRKITKDKGSKYFINESIKKIGLDSGLSNNKMDNCLNNETTQDEILNERIEAQKKYKIQSTPTIYINKKQYKGKHEYKPFKKVVEKLL